MDAVSFLAQIEKLKADNEKWARAWQKAENEKLNDDGEIENLLNKEALEKYLQDNLNDSLEEDLPEEENGTELENDDEE